MFRHFSTHGKPRARCSEKEKTAQTFRGFEAYSQYVRLVLVRNHGHPHFMLISQVPAEGVLETGERLLIN